MFTVKAGGPRAIFEDDDLLVVDKPAPLVCHSASRPDHPTLANWLREQGLDTPRMINRLDRETSGLVVVAKNERAAKLLGKQVLRRQIEKQYIAICWGRLEQEHGVIDSPIGITKSGVVYTKRVIDADAGKPSVTEFAVEQRLCDFTVVRLRPRTGRAHQLRVHLASVGHPIVGDKIYGLDETLYLLFIEQGMTDELLERLLLPRHALHAAQVTLRHPQAQQECFFEAPLPDDMETFIAGHA
ncbi:MAG TPA: RluA family pseudouridine synthase [Verrucomicrobiae bacterium]|nr:RluA family pseudouridine synthase [Verrucomicrobiae bacterium]